MGTLKPQMPGLWGLDPALVLSSCCVASGVLRRLRAASLSVRGAWTEPAAAGQCLYGAEDGSTQALLGSYRERGEPGAGALPGLPWPLGRAHLRLWGHSLGTLASWDPQACQLPAGGLPALSGGLAGLTPLPPGACSQPHLTGGAVLGARPPRGER